MIDFSNVIRSSLGDLYGWKGGKNNNSRKPNTECAIRRDLNSMRNLAALVRASVEQEKTLFANRYNELIMHNIAYLENRGRIPPGVSVGNIANWLNLNLDGTVASLTLALVRQEDAYRQFREREHDLFLKQENRSKWLQVIGLGKSPHPAPMILRCSDGTIISNPCDIKKLYITRLSPILRTPISLSQIELTEGLIEFESPSLKSRNFIPQPRTKKGNKTPLVEQEV
jgi:hypothetical protein